MVAAAAPSREGWFPVSPSQQQLPPHGPGCSCCKLGGSCPSLPLPQRGAPAAGWPRSLALAAENNFFSVGELSSSQR